MAAQGYGGSVTSAAGGLPAVYGSSSFPSELPAGGLGRGNLFSNEKLLHASFPSEADTLAYVDALKHSNFSQWRSLEEVAKRAGGGSCSGVVNTSVLTALYLLGLFNLCAASPTSCCVPLPSDKRRRRSSSSPVVESTLPPLLNSLQHNLSSLSLEQFNGLPHVTTPDGGRIPIHISVVEQVRKLWDSNPRLLSNIPCSSATASVRSSFISLSGVASGIILAYSIAQLSECYPDHRPQGFNNNKIWFFPVPKSNPPQKYVIRSLPTEIPVTGEDDPDDGCDRQSVRMEDGRCAHLLSSDQCPYMHWVLINRDTRKGECVPRLCPEGKVFVEFDQMCHVVDEPDYCPEGQRLFMTAWGEAVCDCLDGMFHGADGECHRLYEPGYCDEGTVLQFHKTTKALACKVDPCDHRNSFRQAKELPYAKAPRDGVCYKLSSTGPCSHSQKFGYDIEKLSPACITLQEAGLARPQRSFQYSHMSFPTGIDEDFPHYEVSYVILNGSTWELMMRSVGRQKRETHPEDGGETAVKFLDTREFPQNMEEILPGLREFDLIHEEEEGENKEPVIKEQLEEAEKEIVTQGDKNERKKEIVAKINSKNGTKRKQSRRKFSRRRRRRKHRRKRKKGKEKGKKEKETKERGHKEDAKVKGKPLDNGQREDTIKQRKILIENAHHKEISQKKSSDIIQTKDEKDKPNKKIKDELKKHSLIIQENVFLNNTQSALTKTELEVVSLTNFNTTETFLIDDENKTQTILNSQNHDSIQVTPSSHCENDTQPLLLLNQTHVIEAITKTDVQPLDLTKKDEISLIGNYNETQNPTLDTVNGKHIFLIEKNKTRIQVTNEQETKESSEKLNERPASATTGGETSLQDSIDGTLPLPLYTEESKSDNNKTRSLDSNKEKEQHSAYNTYIQIWHPNQNDSIEYLHSPDETTSVSSLPKYTASHTKTVKGNENLKNCLHLTDSEEGSRTVDKVLKAEEKWNNSSSDGSNETTKAENNKAADLHGEDFDFIPMTISNGRKGATNLLQIILEKNKISKGSNHSSEDRDLHLVKGVIKINQRDLDTKLKMGEVKATASATDEANQKHRGRRKRKKGRRRRKRIKGQRRNQRRNQRKSRNKNKMSNNREKNKNEDQEKNLGSKQKEKSSQPSKRVNKKNKETTFEEPLESLDLDLLEDVSLPFYLRNRGRRQAKRNRAVPGIINAPLLNQCRPGAKRDYNGHCRPRVIPQSIFPIIRIRQNRPYIPTYPRINCIKGTRMDSRGLCRKTFSGLG